MYDNRKQQFSTALQFLRGMPINSKQHIIITKHSISPHVHRPLKVIENGVVFMDYFATFMSFTTGIVNIQPLYKIISFYN